MTEIIFETDWLSVKQDDSYIYSHEKRCNGQIIAVVPYRLVTPTNFYGLSIPYKEFLFRKEICPAWDLNGLKKTCVTGGHDQPLIVQTAVKEILEETGYEVDTRQLVSLGKCQGVKSCDTTYYLFTVNLTDIKPNGDACGDGSVHEKLAENYWAKENEFVNTDDPIVGMIYTRLKFYKFL